MTARSLPRFEPIETERLLVRPLEPSDVDALHARRNDPSTAQFQGWDVPYPLERAQRLVDDVVALDAEPPGDGWFQVTVAELDTGRIVGDVSLHLTFGGRCVELGWTVDIAARRNGYATEAVAAVAAWCFETLGVSRVSATMHPDNVASARVAERVGMLYEGVARKGYWLDRADGTAENSDDARYAMTDDEWRAWLDRPRSSPSQVRLEPVEPDNVDALLGLATHHSQETLVAPMAVSLAQALGFVLADQTRVVPWPRAIVADDEIVGFVMLTEPTDQRPDAYLWRLLIDRLHQRRGIGRVAVGQVIEQARAWGSEALTVSWSQEPGSPEAFYLGLGFEPTGEIHDGEIQGRLTL